MPLGDSRQLKCAETSGWALRRWCCSFSDPTKADDITFGGRVACASYGCTQGEEGFDVEIGAYGLQFAFWGYLQGLPKRH